MADIEAGVDLFAGVEDIVGIKDVFALLEDIEHFFSKHKVEVRRADDAVVVFATDVAVKFNSGSEKRLGHFFNQGSRRLISEI